MSGHSHYDTIHRQKELKDAAKGNIFSKMSKAIAIAVKTGGGGDPDSNFKLRVVMDKARAVNMPKDNIQRAIVRASAEAQNVEEVAYEGFGPAGVSVIVEAATDNRNRTAQEIKNLFEKSGGRMGGPGSVAFNFENTGLVVVQKKEDAQTEMLELIDLGAADVEESEEGIDVYIQPDKLREVREKIEAAGFTVKSTELYMRPRTFQTVTDPKDVAKVINFLDNLNEHEDVQKVFDNLEVPPEAEKSAASASA